MVAWSLMTNAVVAGVRPARRRDDRYRLLGIRERFTETPQAIVERGQVIEDEAGIGVLLPKLGADQG